MTLLVLPMLTGGLSTGGRKRNRDGFVHGIFRGWLVRYGLLTILSLSGFVTSFGAHIVATNLPSYAEAVGVSAFTIGLLIAVYDFAELFAKPLAGFVADRHGMKRILLAGLVVFILGSVLFLIISPRLLLLVRFVQGLGAAALSTVSISLVARHSAAKRGQAFGAYAP